MFQKRTRFLTTTKPVPDLLTNPRLQGKKDINCLRLTIIFIYTLVIFFYIYTIKIN
jgi:hypothetical protein